MALLRASTTKSEWLPDDPTAFVPSMPWKSPLWAIHLTQVATTCCGSPGDALEVVTIVA
jgi:hypothetical protein